MRGNQILHTAHRVLHMAYMIQRLISGKPHHLFMVLVIAALIGGAYLGYVYLNDPGRALASADAKWDAQERTEAVRSYKKLLREFRSQTQLEKDVQLEIPRLYRRVISYEAEYGDPAEARDWIRNAWQDDVRSLSFESTAAAELWRQTIEDLKR